jgi:hypothetical protein
VRTQGAVATLFVFFLRTLLFSLVFAGNSWAFAKEINP